MQELKDLEKSKMLKSLESQVQNPMEMDGMKKCPKCGCELEMESEEEDE